MDVTDRTMVDAVVAQVKNQFGRIDVLVNNAGITKDARLQKMTIAQFDQVIDVNLNGTQRLCALSRPLLAKTKGAIVNTASMRSFSGASITPAYSASKGAVMQLTKSLAIAYADDGIRVNAIAPGWVATALTKPLRENPEANKAVIDRTPLKRWADPADMAGPVLFLCSPAAAFVTGVILPVDGGYLVV
jgi:NAD(P)-dependent dehydrogenase (short-subunit alcohol dehydrogenase family)